jgi:hypothetical protein
VTTPTIAQTQVIIDWIRSLGWDDAQELGYPLLPGPLILSEPDRSVWITGSGGPGYVTEEGSVDASTFQVRVRGTMDDIYGPELVAGQLDFLILKAAFPVVIDGVPIQSVTRNGSGPTPLPVDPNDNRHEFTCSYIIAMGV